MQAEPMEEGRRAGGCRTVLGSYSKYGGGGLGRESKWESDVTGWTFQ